MKRELTLLSLILPLAVLWIAGCGEQDAGTGSSMPGRDSNDSQSDIANNQASNPAVSADA